MNDQEFKKQLSSLLGNPPSAPANEYQQILRKLDSKKQSVWVELKPLLPAFTLLLFVVLFVSPRPRTIEQQSVVSFYSEDEGLSTDIFVK